MGYAQPFIMLEFSDLSEDPEGDLIWVKIRNPKLLTQDAFVTPEGMGVSPDNKPDLSSVSLDAVRAASLENIARVVVAWHVYDATDLGDDPPLLELPATAEKVGKLPATILNQISQHIRPVLNPT